MPELQWDEWKISQPCQTRDRELCGAGSQILKRKCILRENCIGSDEKIIDCWSHIGCPVDLQPPTNVEMFSDGNGNFYISWTIVPYGEIPSSVQIFLTMVNSKDKDIQTVSRDLAISHDALKEQSHSLKINFSTDLSNEHFYKLTIRLLTVSVIGKQSMFTEPVTSVARAGRPAV